MHVEVTAQEATIDLGAFLLLILWAWSWLPRPIAALSASLILLHVCYKEEVLEWAIAQEAANQAAIAAWNN